MSISQINSAINHSDLVVFAQSRINLPAEIAQQYRDQGKLLCERLAARIAEDPNFGLIKMLQAGSLAKGTALKTINDIDVAVYIQKEKAPGDDRDLVPWLAQRLREANSMMKPEQFDDTQPHCVTISYRGSGLDVDVVPVLYEGAARDMGYLVNKRTGVRTLTSIPMHLEFILARKKKYPEHYAQIVRLVKWWVQKKKNDDDTFKCKSFLIELLVAYLVDNKGLILTDYPRALETIFSYIVKSGLEERIFFVDYYSKNKLPVPSKDPIQIFDPINPGNNIAKNYTIADREKLVAAAEEAADSISEAMTATTKARAVECWQRVFSSSFRG